MSDCALITGITGQAGSYLAEFLLEKGYQVHGTVRNGNADRIRHLKDRITLHAPDLLDAQSVAQLLERVTPREVYNLAGHSFVPTSWKEPLSMGEATGLGVAYLLEAIRQVDPSTRFFQASSSEMFGSVTEEPQNERTPFRPRNPYGVAKVYGHFMTVNYREQYGMHAVSGIMFNHESPRRAKHFVTRKITDAVARIKHGLADHVKLGNLDAERDWGYAGDYVRAMWMMLARDTPEDYVIATGQKHSVRQWVECAFARAGLDWKAHVQVDSALLRPADVNTLCGDPTRAHRNLDWTPSVDFEKLVHTMVDADLASVARQPEVR